MAEEKTEAKYLAKYLNLKIVKKSAVTREVNGQAITTPGESIRFVQGLYQTSDPEEQAFIEARPEFAKGMIIRVPDNVQDLLAKRAEWSQDLEAREAEIAKKEAELGIKATKEEIKGSAEGAGAGKVDVEDGLEEKKIKELVEIATNEGVPADAVEPFTKKPGSKSEAARIKVGLVEIIRANRKENNEAGNGPAY
jgi:hypothetical protein